MRYAVISDIHANLESLKKFITLIPKYSIDKIIFLGDIVGYNTNPNECIQVMTAFHNLESIRGNHDRAVRFQSYDNFSDIAAEAVRWTVENLNISSEKFLEKLDEGPKIIDNLFAVCHGSSIDEDYYILSKYDTKFEFDWLKKHGLKLLFFGHTHQQKIYCRSNKGNINEIKEKKVTLQADHYYLINPGSLGQPRDNDRRASFIILDSDNLTIMIVRYEYAYQITQKKIMTHHLPPILASRLEIGR